MVTPKQGTLIRGVYGVLRGLREAPFLFGDEEMERTIERIRDVDRAVARNVRKLAKASKIKPAKAREELLSLRQPFPEAGVRTHLPRVEDIAANVREWGLYVEDEADARSEVKGFFEKSGIKVRTVEAPDEFETLMKKRPYLQYWVDIGLGPNGEDMELGRGLVAKLLKAKLDGEVVIYTQHSGWNKLHPYEKLIIDKSRPNRAVALEHKVGGVLRVLKTEYKIDPSHPLLRVS